MSSFWCFGFTKKPRGVENQKKHKDKSHHKTKPDQTSSSGSLSAKPATPLSDSETQQHGWKKCPSFTYQELATATNNFNYKSLIGRGGFGAVFRGKLESTGQDIAVKTLDETSVQGDKEFLVEVMMLSTLHHHENLVKLLGYCGEGDHRILVYELMPLGSVEDHLHNHGTGQRAMNWETRMKIALGAAKGLEHLHDKAEPSVIYRDLKTPNILLDQNYKPKLSDFGLAKFAPTGDETHVSTRVMGTHGYCAPEYALTGQLTVKSDIYSFGVVMLELITGRKAIADSPMDSYHMLVDWAVPLYMQRKIKYIVDPRLRIHGRVLKSSLDRALDVTFRCLREDANVRPPIRYVVGALDFIVTTLENEKKKARAASVNVGVREEEEEEEGSFDVERERAIAEAKSWAESCRKGKRQSIDQPSTSSS